MVDTAIHDVADPALDLASNLAGSAFGAHGNVNILATVVDLGDGADEVLSHTNQHWVSVAREGNLQQFQQQKTREYGPQHWPQ